MGCPKAIAFPNVRQATLELFGEHGLSKRIQDDDGVIANAERVIGSRTWQVWSPALLNTTPSTASEFRTPMPSTPCSKEFFPCSVAQGN